jgi:nitrile hydratase accessory protein
MFPQAWHARVFALVVALVENGQFSWSAFQARLAARTREKPSAADQHPGDIEDYYFDCWLAAAEETLEAEGLTTVE